METGFKKYKDFERKTWRVKFCCPVCGHAHDLSWSGWDKVACAGCGIGVEHPKHKEKVEFERHKGNIAFIKSLFIQNDMFCESCKHGEYSDDHTHCSWLNHLMKHNDFCNYYAPKEPDTCD